MERFHIAQTTFFLKDRIFSNLDGPSEQFVTHEKLSCEVGLISRRSNWLVAYSCFQRIFSLK